MLSVQKVHENSSNIQQWQKPSKGRRSRVPCALFLQVQQQEQSRLVRRARDFTVPAMLGTRLISRDMYANCVRIAITYPFECKILALILRRTLRLTVCSRQNSITTQFAVSKRQKAAMATIRTTMVHRMHDTGHWQCDQGWNSIRCV